MKKIIVDGVEYVAKDGEPEVTPEVTPTPPTETPAGGATPEVEDEKFEEKLDEAAEKLMSKLGITEIQASLKKLNEKLESNKKEATPKVSTLLDLEKLMKKDVSQMTAKEKIIGFFQAAIQSNHAVLKALAEGSTTDGGYLFPDEFRSEIIRDIAETPHMRNEVTVVPMKRDVMKIPTLASGPKVTWTAENATKSTTTAHFGEATLTAYKMAAILYASDELIEDSTEVDIVQFIIRLFSEAIGNEEDRVITRGGGTTEPIGYHAFTGLGAVSCAAAGLDFDQLINLEFLLPTKYLRNAKFYVHRNNVREMRKLKDGQSRYLWQDSVVPGQPATFHGYPVIEDNNLPESDIYFGDLKQAYWFGDRKMMTVKISQDTETAFTKDQTAIRVVERIAGTVVLTNALKRLQNIP